MIFILIMIIPIQSLNLYYKKKLSKTHKIILGIGDQYNDIKALKNCLSIKLPDKIDKNAYFTYNNINYYQI